MGQRQHDLRVHQGRHVLVDEVRIRAHQPAIIGEALGADRLGEIGKPYARPLHGAARVWGAALQPHHIGMPRQLFENVEGQGTRQLRGAAPPVPLAAGHPWPQFFRRP
jgi:hypothetical protein